VAQLLLGDHLRSAIRQLEDGPHPDRARMDAEALLGHVLNRNRAWLIANHDASVSPEQSQTYSDLLARRLAGEPIQYILREAEFYGLPFRVTPDVLIPRPETEHLVETVIEFAKRFERPRIVDVGTGSGAIAIALAHVLPNAHITATDLSPAALELARENAVRNGLSNRVRFLQGDLLQPVDAERFDIVVSNPPYVPDADRASLAIEVRDHEPALALFAGQDGLSIYRRLIPAAYASLTAGGFIALEIGWGQAQDIEHLLIAGGFRDVELTPDLQCIPRVASAQRT
jgi:release factor glutamine methyltransferase